MKETGEIWIKSPSLMSGYYNDPEATEKSVNNGWFKTGDVREVSSEHILIKGRADNVINLGGMKVYPEEINQVIRSHQDVLDCYNLSMESHRVSIWLILLFDFYAIFSPSFT